MQATRREDRQTGAAVDVIDVTCTFGRVHALNGLSLRVPTGTVVGIVGPNGAGKTTLIDVICGLVRPSSGIVRVLGEDVRARGAALRGRIGVLPQETALYDELTPEQNLRFAAALYDVPRPAARIAEVLELVGLSGRARDRVRGFSGGMQRRVAIARALLHNPPLLILDEPTVGVDVEARHQIWAHIRSLRAGGRTVVLTTNYLDEAEALLRSCRHSPRRQRGRRGYAGGALRADWTLPRTGMPRAGRNRPERCASRPPGCAPHRSRRLRPAACISAPMRIPKMSCTTPAQSA